MTRECYYTGCVNGQRMNNESGQIESCFNCRGIGTITSTNLEAFSEDREKSWSLSPYLYEGRHGLVLQLVGPISYYVADLLSFSDHETFCIDAGGRNFGVYQSVLVDRKALQDAIKELQSA